MPVTVYAISFPCGGYYIGMTANLDRRLQEHARKQSPSLKHFEGDGKLIYSKVFPDHSHARTHEKYLKSGAGRALLKSITT